LDLMILFHEKQRLSHMYDGISLENRPWRIVTLPSHQPGFAHILRIPHL
jgi:hypothetical protein